MPRRSLRPDILESGLELVHRNGFSSTGVAAIADAAGCPKGSFYNHFRSKEDFSRAILERYFEDVKATMDETLFTEDGLAIDRVKTYFVRLRDYNSQDNFARGCLIGNISAEAAAVSDETRTKLNCLYSDWTKSISICLKDGQLDGSVRSDTHADTLAGLLLDGWQGTLLRAKVEQSSRALDNFISVLLPALASVRT